MVTHRQRNKSLYTRTQTRRAAQKVIQLCHLETHGAAAVELLRRYETPGQACACLTSLAWCGHRIAIEIRGRPWHWPAKPSVMPCLTESWLDLERWFCTDAVQGKHCWAISLRCQQAVLHMVRSGQPF